MKLHTIRPEDRSRHAEEAPAWVDTHPACFRSEGFAEDLAEAAPGSALATGKDRSAAGSRGRRWWGDAALPMLGLALAGVISAVTS